jgi:hypothetical protein
MSRYFESAAVAELALGAVGAEHDNPDGVAEVVFVVGFAGEVGPATFPGSSSISRRLSIQPRDKRYVQFERPVSRFLSWRR